MTIRILINMHIVFGNILKHSVQNLMKLKPDTFLIFT